MSMKKFMSLFLALVMCVSVLAGCETAEQGASPAGSGDEEPVAIEWLAYNTYGMPNPDEPLIKYVEERYNVKFDFWFVDDQRWEEVLGVRLAGGDMPDFMRVKDSSMIPTYVRQGIVAEVTDEMLERMPNYANTVKQYDPNGLGFQDAYYQDKLYLMKEANPGGAYPTAIVWRKDWLDKLGIERIPSTIDEFYDAAVKIVKGDPNGDGGKVYAFSNTIISAIFGAFGPIPLKEFRGAGTQNLFYTIVDDKIEFAATQPYIRDALELLRKWYAEGLIDPEFVTGENTGGNWAQSQAFENGRVAVTGMSMANHWAPPLYESDNAGVCLRSFMELAGSPLPAVGDASFQERVAAAEEFYGKVFAFGPAIEGSTGASGSHTWGAYGANGFVMTTKAAEDPRKVDFWIQLNEDMNTDYELYYMFTYGMEGTHYELDENGARVHLTPYNEGTARQYEAGMNVFARLRHGDFLKRDNPPLYELYEEVKTTGYTDVIVPQTTDASRYLPDMRTYTLETFIQIITGEKDVDFFDEYVKVLMEDLGGQIVLDSINELR